MVEEQAARAGGRQRGRKGPEDPEAKRARKAAKRERQRLKKQLEKQHQDDDEFPEPEPLAEGASRRKVAPLTTFIPSVTRRQLLQALEPAQKARRRRGFGGAYIEYSGVLEQVKRLQCPVVWRLEPMATTVQELYTILDSSPYCGSSWQAAVEQIQVACDFAERDRRMLWKSRELLEDVYAMLEDENLDGSSVLGKYLPGLKHVLDATWLLLRDDADARADRPLPDGTLVGDVLLFEELDEQQRAGVYAIKAVMAKVDVEAADKALQLDPSEGQWYYVKWLCLRAVRARKQGLDPEDLDDLDPKGLESSTAKEEALLRTAHRLRKTPQTIVAVARACLAGPTKDIKQCGQLLREAVGLFPQCPYVHFNCGHLYRRLARGKKNAQDKRDAEEKRGAEDKIDAEVKRVSEAKRDAQKVFLSFKTAIQLSQGLWRKALLDWGTYCVERGCSDEGFYHLRKAGVVRSG